MFFQRFSQSGKSGKKKTESQSAVVGELEVGKSPLSELGGDRLKEMEKVHSMEEEEVQELVFKNFSRFQNAQILYILDRQKTTY